VETVDTKAELDAVINDSHLILAYLRDSGIGQGRTLADAVTAAERLRDARAYTAGLAELNDPVAVAVHDIAPYITLNDLRAGRSPFARGMRAAFDQSAKRFVVAFAAVASIFAVVLGFSITQDINRDLADLQRILLQDPQQKLVELRRLLEERPLTDPKSAYYVQYKKAREEVMLMFDTANDIIDRTAGVDPQRPDGMVGELLSVLRKEIIGLKKSAGLPSSSIGDSGAATATTPEPNAPPTSHCSPYDNGEVTKLVGPNNKALLIAAVDLFDDYCLAQTLGINTGKYRPAAANNVIGMLQEELFLIGVLFLPLVGGLLGSIVFVVQGQLSNGLKPPMTWGYLIVRILIGGAFGVMIGWFSSNQVSSLDFAQHVSGTPFTLAVIAGFSIETLFAVIVRYSKQGAPAQKGTSAQQGASSQQGTPAQQGALA